MKSSSLFYWTSLHYATNNGYLDIVELLLKNIRIDVNAINKILFYAHRFILPFIENSNK